MCVYVLCTRCVVFDYVNMFSINGNVGSDEYDTFY